MLLKVLFTLLGLVYPPNPQNADRGEYVPIPGGPQSWEEEDLARKALHGIHYGGDMVFPDDYNTTDAAIKYERYRWQKTEGKVRIPYIIDNSSMRGKKVIMEGLRMFEKHTCIQPVPWNGQRDYVRIFYGNGCWSMIGRVGGEQKLSLGDGCYYKGLVMHEMCHALGLFHEHQRSDRDNYIKVYLQNVVSGQQHNFDKTNPNDEMKPLKNYDYDSIMHYGDNAFSKNPYSLRTMEAKNGHQLVEPYAKTEFTQSDLNLIKRMYQC